MEDIEEKPGKDCDVVVVGACFRDFLMYVPRCPKRGEVVYGEKFMLDFGGKGPNMCIMAAKLGARPAMVSVVGNDLFGREIIENFKKFGVNTDHINITDEAATGITHCMVDNDGEPSFVAILAANKLLSLEHVDQSKSLIEKGKILITNKGIPLPTALSALKLGKKCGLITIFNAAPKIEKLDDEFYKVTDIFVVNMEEAQSLAKKKVSNQDEVKAACLWFHEQGVYRVVVTMGANGAIGSERDMNNDPPRTSVFHVPAKKANVVDTTGAGDAFTGAFAFYLAHFPQLSFKEMVTCAVTIATKTVEVEGAQKSYPDKGSLPSELFS